MGETKKGLRFSFVPLLGLLLVVGGTLLVLEHLGVVLPFEVWDLWPLVLIFIGLAGITERGRHNNPFFSLFLLGIGVLLLLNNLNYLNFDWDIVWPLAILFVGLSILYNHLRGPSGAARRRHGGLVDDASSDDHLNLSAVMGGGDYRISQRTLKGGRISVIMGGFDVDMREADMEGKEMTIDASAVMGGVEIRVPDTWEVVVHGSPILGGIDNNTRRPEDPQKRLVVNGSAIMGAVEVRN